MPRCRRNGAYQRCGAVNRRVRSPRARDEGNLPLPKTIERAILGSKSRGIWRMSIMVAAIVLSGSGRPVPASRRSSSTRRRRRPSRRRRRRRSPPKSRPHPRRRCRLRPSRRASGTLSNAEVAERTCSIFLHLWRRMEYMSVCLPQMESHF